MTDDEIARQAREIAAFCIPSSWNELPLSPHARAILVGAAETRILAVLRTTASAAWVEGWKAGQEAMRERAAKVCEEDVHNQHPAKPAGVVMSRYPASKPHAYLIRALQPLPPKKDIG